jgi:broad specificity phosphatase PhoE
MHAWKTSTDPLIHPLTHLYTSPMLRAVSTGLPSARALGLPLVSWKDLHEGGGLFLLDEETGENVGQQGPDRAVMAERFPDLVWPPELGDGPWWNRPAELSEERIPRARRVLTELLVRHPPESNDNVVFFTHGAFCNYFMAALLGPLEQRAPIWFSFFNTAITCLSFRPQREPRLRFLNRLPHLPDDMITD